MTTSKTACLVCKDDSQHRIVETHGIFTILECSVCGLQYSDPVEYSSDSYRDSYEGSPDDLGKNYEVRLQHDLQLIRASQALDWQEPYKRRVIGYLQKNLGKNAAVLDIGCGSGIFLAALKEANLDPYGIDVAPAPIAMLSEAGFKVSVGSLGDQPEEWPEPAAVTIIEVLEHVPDPAGLLQEIREQFPRTTVVITVPSQRRWILRNGRESSDYPPNHLTRWTPEALTRLLTDVGFQPRILNPKVQGYQLITPPEKWLRPKLRSNRPGRSGNGRGEGKSSPSRPFSKNGNLRRAKSILYSLLAFYLNRRGYTDHSMIAIGTPKP